MLTYQKLFECQQGKQKKVASTCRGYCSVISQEPGRAYNGAGIAVRNSAAWAFYVSNHGSDLDQDHWTIGLLKITV